jgi:hypothetical protein
VVDNASNDSRRDLIPQSCPVVSYIYNERNLGFAGGNNAALRRIISSESEAVLLLNNDAVISEPHLVQLLAALDENPRLGVVGPLLEARQGSRRTISAGGRDIARFPQTRIVYPPGGRAASHGASVCVETPDGRPMDANSLRVAAYVPGTAVVIRTSLLRSVGLLEEAYFFSGEMADFCRRAQSAGWTCAISPQALALHAPAGGRLRDTLYRYYNLRNRFLFIRRHEPARRRLFGFWLGCGAAMAARAILCGRPAAARAVLLALRDGLAGRFGNRNDLFGA